MTQTYAARRRAGLPPDTPAPQAQGPSLQALRAGAAPTQEQLGSRVDLPGAIREKMEASFGADLSAVQLYESQAVADAGAQAMTMGNRVAFAPGQLDLASTAGQSLLGHELSHVVSQARGEVPGSGFLNDRALEARADQEGALAAAGESVYTGPVTPLSASSVTSAAGPMQAKKPMEAYREHKAAQAEAAKQAELKQYFPAIGAKEDILRQTNDTRAQQSQAAEAYAKNKGTLAGDAQIGASSGGRQFLSLFRQGDDSYNEQLNGLWTAGGGLNTEMSEEEMMNSYTAVSAPIFQQLMALDPDSLGTDEDSVRANFLTNNELVGRLNSLTDIRKAMAGHMVQRGEGESKADYDQRVAAKSESIRASMLQNIGIDPAQAKAKFGMPGAKGKAMQKAMGIQGRMDAAYADLMDGKNDPEYGANPEYDTMIANREANKKKGFFSRLFGK